MDWEDVGSTTLRRTVSGTLPWVAGETSAVTMRPRSLVKFFQIRFRLTMERIFIVCPGLSPSRHLGTLLPELSESRYSTTS